MLHAHPGQFGVRGLGGGLSLAFIFVEGNVYLPLVFCFHFAGMMTCHLLLLH